MFKSWPKIPRFENEVYHITEKIDGTNACIIITKEVPEIANYCYRDNEYTVYAQSRTRLLTINDDNFGFSRWVNKNAEQLIKDLGEGHHFGEWWGNGINRGYGLDHKRFSLFNPTKHSEVCYNVPSIRSLTVEEFENVDWYKGTKEELIECGSIASKGFMKPEGFILYAEKAKTYWKVIIDK